MQQWLHAMKICPSKPKDFLLEEVESLYVPDKAFPKKQRTEKDAWQSVHMTYFEAVECPWPPSRGALAKLMIHCQHLSDRELEVLVLADHLYPMKPPTGHDIDKAKDMFDCIDVNDDMRRHFGQLGDKESLKNPWKSGLIMTLCGSSHVIMRFISGNWLFLIERLVWFLNLYGCYEHCN